MFHVRLMRFYAGPHTAIQKLCGMLAPLVVSHLSLATTTSKDTSQKNGKSSRSEMDEAGERFRKDKETRAISMID
ncbi:hypothetical protein BofuT4_P061680.1 [Botrytis cinerea T4]|uniref:Uncharacterized protein n=1 Tax=Botryotinia fuckeliana (strain T4) TaxID=999810 RepID=G2XTY8_BOTF4|nr:hypothetical protein BofuT4_P061680.1 [Botrytis cinerea T4]